MCLLETACRGVIQGQSHTVSDSLPWLPWSGQDRGWDAPHKERSLSTGIISVTFK